MDSDVIVGQRVALSGASQRWQDLAKLDRSRLVYELDDDLLGVDPSNGPAWDFFSKPEIRSNIKRNIQCADLVTVSSPSLAEAVSQLNPNVAIIPNYVPAWLLRIPTPNIPDGLTTVGWGGGASHAMDWAEAESEVARFVFRTRNVEMHLMGWLPKDLWRRLPESRRRHTEWIEELPDLYRKMDFHIGVAPLRAHVFNRSKSHIKALEYAALGIPSVCSNVGPYADFVRQGETGFLVTQPHQWASYLRELLDPDLRQAMGDKARGLAQGHTIEANVGLWEAALCQ
jgi:glycosyltransferase involved in cell wall biosynthesis